MKILSYIAAGIAVIIGLIFIAQSGLIKDPQPADNEPDGTATSTETALIRVTSPKPNQEISSPVVITGEARGTWFFEASFPIVITNWDGLIIAEGYAQAEEDWMTENFVPFTATVKFDKPEFNERGIIILKKDNPSGLPEHDAAIEIPIRFK